jgi:hypothetical protein
MNSLMNKWVKNSLTESDNETVDLFRVSLALAMLTFVGLSIYATILSGKFDAMAYGAGFGALLGGGGLGVGIKGKMERPAFSAKPKFDCEGEGDATR